MLFRALSPVKKICKNLCEHWFFLKKRYFQAHIYIIILFAVELVL